MGKNLNTPKTNNRGFQRFTRHDPTRGELGGEPTNRKERRAAVKLNRYATAKLKEREKANGNT
jgi:hypothetical protein